MKRNISQQSDFFGAQPKLTVGKGGPGLNGMVKPLMAKGMKQPNWIMNAALTESQQPTLGAGTAVKEQQPPATAPESAFKIEHAFELLDEGTLSQQTPAHVQSVKLEEFKSKLDNLECLFMRDNNDEAQVVAREIAQRLYLSEDKQTIVMEPVASPVQLQMVSLLNAASTEVQEAIKVFRDQLIQK